MSPYLFVVVMDAFSSLLTSRFNAGLIGFHPRTAELGITHLMFADDVMLFYDGSINSLHGISDALSDFASWSGLKVNAGKTHLYLVGENQEENRRMTEFGFPRGSLPIRYLGLPLMSRKLKISEYELLVVKVEERLSSWEVKALSFAGRAQLIKSVITGMINFWMQTFILPKGCVSRLEALCARYLWFGKIEMKRGAKVSWKQVCLPKQEGGLGIRRISDWNKTLCLKLVWILHSNADSLWAKWHAHHNIKNTSFWELKDSTRDSWTWKIILHLRPLAAKFLRSEVRNGRTTSFWFDNWTPFGPLIRFLGDQGPAQARLARECKVSSATNEHGWCIQEMRSQNGRDFHRFLAGIQPPSAGLGKDRYTWWTNSTSNSKFLARQTWEEIRGRSVETSWTDVVWFRGAIPAHAFTMWIAQLNRLPTRLRIHTWDNTQSAVCCICGNEEESREHLFLLCPFVVHLWRMVFIRLSPMQSQFHSWSQMLNWARTSTSPSPNKLRKIVMQALIYFTWRQRNLKLHENRMLCQTEAERTLDKDIKNILASRRWRRKWRAFPLLWLR